MHTLKEKYEQTDFFHNRETLVHNFTNTWEISPIVGKFMYYMPHTTGTDSLGLAFL